MASIRYRKRVSVVVAVLVCVALVLLVATGTEVPSSPGDAQDGACPEQPPDAPVQDVFSAHAEAVEEYETPLAVQEAAEEAVVRYRDRGDCVLAQAGYLDLFGGTWGCVVEGPGWVDVCVVARRQGEKASTVKTMRMEVADWEQVYGSRE